MKSSKWLWLGAILILVLVGVAYASGGTDVLQGNLRNAKVADFGVKNLPITTTFSPGQNSVELMKFEVDTKNQPAVAGATFTLTTTGSGMLHAFLYPGFINFYDMSLTDSAGTVVSEVKWPGGGDDGTNTDNGYADDFLNTITFNQFTHQPAAGTTETFILKADIGNSATLTDDPTTIQVTLDSIFGQSVNLVGPTLTAVP